MAGLTFDGIPSTRIDSNTFSGTNVLGSIFSGTYYLGTTYSGATVFSSASISGLNVNSAGSVLDAQGRLRSAGLGSATTAIFGGWVQAGSAATSAGSVGFTAWANAFSDTNYYVVLTAESIAGGGSFAPWISGTKSTSGVSFVGGASTRYNYIAVGT